MCGERESNGGKIRDADEPGQSESWVATRDTNLRKMPRNVLSLELLSGSASTRAESVSAVDAGTCFSWSGTARLVVAMLSVLERSGAGGGTG